MVKRSRTSLFAGVLLVAALAVTGCNANAKPGESAPADKPTASATVEQGGTMYYLSRKANESFESASAQMVPTSRLRWVHRGLTTWNTTPDGDPELVADLATDLGTTTDGGKTWEFTLKEGLKFSDGTPITAQDVKYGVERSFAPIFQGGLGYHKTLLEGAADYAGPYDGKELSGIEVKDDRTLVFHLTRSFGDWPWIVGMPAFAPVPKAADTTPETYAENPVASGPYKITKYAKGSEVIFERNEYWSKDSDPVRLAGPDKIILQMGLNNDTIVQRLIDDKGNDKNAISNALISTSQFQRIDADPAVSARLANSSSGYFQYIALNVTSPNLTNVKVRQAINYAINKTEIQSVYGGAKFGGDITSTIMTPGINGYTNYNLYDGGATGDVEKAKALLAEAGVTNLTLSLTYPADYSEKEEKVAQSIKNALAKVGITVELKGTDSDSWYELTTSGGQGYDLSLNGWGADFPSGMSTIQPLFGTSEIGNGGGNSSNYSNPAVDKAIEEASSEPDQKKAGELWAAIDKQIMADAPLVPLLVQHTQALAGSNIVNYFIPNTYPPFANELVVGVAH